MSKTKTVVILSVSSDIGLDLAKRYLNDGYNVVGTYLRKGRVGEIASLPGCYLLPCDITSKKSIRLFISAYRSLGLHWETFISAVGDPRPLSSFFSGNFNEWSRSIHVNAIEQLRVLYEIYPFRVRKKITNVVFFAAGGVNNAVVNFSAYTVSKLMLIKMCEYLDAENPDLNIFIVGPGKTLTKIHSLILSDKDVSKQKYEETKSFLNSKQGTSKKDIYDCIKVFCKEGKTAASGRNFSVVSDPWKGDARDRLVSELKKDKDMYKLRRYRNYL